MSNKKLSPDFIFETSWEVCNKVGGIYTVLSSRAKTLQEVFPDKVVFLGPDLRNDAAPFKEDPLLLPKWKEAAARAGLAVRIGRWMVPGNPVAVLIDFSPLYADKDQMMRHRCFRWRQAVLPRLSSVSVLPLRTRLFIRPMNG